LLLLGGIALAGGLAVAALQTIQESTGTSDRVVTVYRLHGCTCVFSWVSSLEAAGFTVRVVELGSLATVRSTLHTPASLHGCHLGNYLSYFVEGHVTPDALKSLASQHPIALGVTTESSVNAGRIHTSVADEEHSPVVLVEPSGQMLPWFKPPQQPPSDGDHG
jgi:hypothetical protein